MLFQSLQTPLLPALLYDVQQLAQIFDFVVDAEFGCVFFAFGVKLTAQDACIVAAGHITGEGVTYYQHFVICIGSDFLPHMLEEAYIWFFNTYIF